MDKSPDAFRTISEVAEHLETPAHVLRFWESRFPQIRPVKRAGGRRYYRPSDVSLLIGIKRLLHDEGMTIRGVQKILREQGVRHVSGLSGDGVDDADSDAPFVDMVEDAVVTVAPLRPMPGLAEAMAKVIDHGPIKPARAAAPSVSLPAPPAAQGALLLTPAEKTESKADAVLADVIAKVDPDVEQEAAGNSLLEEHENALFPEQSMVRTAAFDPSNADVDFEGDDYDDGPVTTLASRIRTLPKGVSTGRAGAELVAIVARLQALRDAMSDPDRTDRS